jgi:hypothetical protein
MAPWANDPEETANLVQGRRHIFPFAWLVREKFFQPQLGAT